MAILMIVYLISTVIVLNVTKLGFIRYNYKTFMVTYSIATLVTYVISIWTFVHIFSKYLKNNVVDSLRLKLNVANILFLMTGQFVIFDLIILMFDFSYLIHCFKDFCMCVWIYATVIFCDWRKCLDVLNIIAPSIPSAPSINLSDDQSDHNNELFDSYF